MECTKANRNLDFLRRNVYACPQEVKEAPYKELMRPVLEYSSSVWDTSGVGLQYELKQFKFQPLENRKSIPNVFNGKKHLKKIM